MKGQDSATLYYDTRPGWGKEPDTANYLRIEETLKLVPPDVEIILDIGCGDGRVSSPLVEQGIRTVGVDISEAALLHFAGFGIIASVDALPFPCSHFDLVLCAEVLEHLPVDIYKKALDEIERVAKRYILVTTPNEEYLPAGFVKCEKCGHTYHMNFHRRSFDKELHRTLFTKYCPVETIGILEWKHNPFIVFLMQRVFGFYKCKRNIVCPRCGHQGVLSHKQGVVWEFVLRVLKKLNYELPAHIKPRWIASLYRRG